MKTKDIIKEALKEFERNGYFTVSHNRDFLDGIGRKSSSLETNVSKNILKMWQKDS